MEKPSKNDVSCLKNGVFHIAIGCTVRVKKSFFNAIFRPFLGPTWTDLTSEVVAQEKIETAVKTASKSPVSPLVASRAFSDGTT